LRELAFRIRWEGATSQEYHEEVRLQRKLAGSKGEFTIQRKVNLQVGEGSLPRLSRRCHGLRKPCKMLKIERLLGAWCLPRRVHVILQDLLLCQREQLW
jgi:hypothetical protein